MARLVTHDTKLSIIQCYAPTNEYDKDVFYEQLQDVSNKVPCHDILLIMDDMNAQI